MLHPRAADDELKSSSFLARNASGSLATVGGMLRVGEETVAITVAHLLIRTAQSWKNGAYGSSWS